MSELRCKQRFERHESWVLSAARPFLVFHISQLAFCISVFVGFHEHCLYKRNKFTNLSAFTRFIQGRCYRERHIHTIVQFNFTLISWPVRSKYQLSCITFYNGNKLNRFIFWHIEGLNEIVCHGSEWEKVTPIAFDGISFHFFARPVIKYRYLYQTKQMNPIDFRV